MLFFKRVSCLNQPLVPSSLHVWDPSLPPAVCSSSSRELSPPFSFIPFSHMNKTWRREWEIDVAQDPFCVSGKTRKGQEIKMRVDSNFEIERRWGRRWKERILKRIERERERNLHACLFSLPVSFASSWLETTHKPRDTKRGTIAWINIPHLYLQCV